MSQALHTAGTGINAGQAQINVIANNVANINTTAYKTANLTFETLYSNTLSNGSAATKEGGGTNPKQIGYGTAIGGITRDFTSGTFVQTGRSLDVMIAGSGFFVVQDDNNKQYFTRDGIFSTDSEGNLVTQSGMKVVGTKSTYTSTGSTNTVQVPTNLTIVTKETPASELKNKYLYELNDANIKSGDFKVTVLNDDGTEKGSVVMNISSTSITVGDMIKDFQKVVTDYNAGKAAADQIELTITLNDGTISFNTGATNSLKFENISTNFVSETGLTNLKTTTDVLNQTVYVSDLNGYDDPDGVSLASTSINEHGVVLASYSSGGTLTNTVDGNGGIIWKYTSPEGVNITGTDVKTSGAISESANFIIEMATMVNQEGMISLNNNLWELGINVGSVYYGMAGHMAFGSLETGGYEGSNVDIASELSNLISAQRMIQMNSRVFSTASSVMEELSYLGS